MGLGQSKSLKKKGTRGFPKIGGPKRFASALAEAVRGSYSDPSIPPNPLPTDLKGPSWGGGALIPLQVFAVFSSGTGQPASAPPDVRDYSEEELHAKKLFDSVASS